MGAGERERESERGRTELLLAISVLQIKMRIEVDEDLLAGLRGSYHPHALLGGRVGTGVAGGGQVVRDVYLYIPPTFICSRRRRGKEGGREEGRKKKLFSQLVEREIDFLATELRPQTV